jgi:hypothetical protein
MTNTSGVRLKLANIRREDEEHQLMLRGRKSIEDEWSGNVSYDDMITIMPIGWGRRYNWIL